MHVPTLLYILPCLPYLLFGQQLLFLPFGRLGYVLRKLRQKDTLRRQQPSTKAVMQGNAYPTTVLSKALKTKTSSLDTKKSVITGQIQGESNLTIPKTTVRNLMQKVHTEMKKLPLTPTPAPLIGGNYPGFQGKSTEVYSKFTPVISSLPSHRKTTPYVLPIPVNRAGNSLNNHCGPGNCTISLKSYETDNEACLYSYSHSSKLEPLLTGLFDATRTKQLPPPLTWKTTVTPEFAQFTQNIMRLVKPNRVLVIGVYTGLGVLASALAINPRGLVVGLEYPQYLKYWEVAGDKFAQTAGLMRRIQIRADKPIPSALEGLVSKEPGSFDLVILDDHALENYMMDYERALSLLRSGGTMLINDVLADGNVIGGRGSNRSPGGQLMDQMNKKVRDDSRVYATLLPFSGGVTLVVKK